MRLRALDPAGTEFYAAAAEYLRKTFRPNRTYALFFLFLGSFPLLLAIHNPGARLMQTLIAVGSYLFFGALGIKLFYHSSATVRNLSKPREGEDPVLRLQRLRMVAQNNDSDPVAALVLQLTDELPDLIASNCSTPPGEAVK